MSEKFFQCTSKTFSSCNIDPLKLILAAPTSCALKNLSETEDLIFAVTGESGLERLQHLADELDIDGADECTLIDKVSKVLEEDSFTLNLTFMLFEAYLGGINLIDINREISEKIYEGFIKLKESPLVQSIRDFTSKEGIISYIVNEIKDRLAYNIVYPTKSVLLSRTRFLVSSEDLYWIIGFLWPKAVGLPDSALVNDIIADTKKHIDNDKSIVLYGKDALLRKIVYYLVVRGLMEQGYRIVYGSPRQRHSLPRTVYICDKPEAGFLTPYISITENRCEHERVALIDIEEYDTKDLQIWFAKKVFEKDNVSVSDKDVEEIVEKHYGNLSLIETLSLYLSVTGKEIKEVLAEKTDYRLSDLIERIIEKLDIAAEISNINANGLLVFPETLMASKNDSLKRVLLYDPSLGLCSFRNEQWLNLMKSNGLERKKFDLGSLWKSISPFHATWSILKYKPNLSIQIFSKAMNTLYDKNSYPVIEAVAILQPDLFHKTLYTYTTYRLELLSGIISENGNWFSSASLILDISVMILKKLVEKEESKYLERYLSLMLKTALFEIDQGFPDIAYQKLLEAWNIVKNREMSPLIRTEIVGNLGLALAGMGRIDEAEKNLRKALDIIEREFENKDIPQKARFLAGLAIIAESRGDLENAFQLYKKALDILVALVYRGACEYVGNMYEVAEKMKEIRKSYKDWRVCGGLVKCGAFELSNKYGCH